MCLLFEVYCYRYYLCWLYVKNTWKLCGSRFFAIFVSYDSVTMQQILVYAFIAPSYHRHFLHPLIISIVFPSPTPSIILSISIEQSRGSSSTGLAHYYYTIVVRSICYQMLLMIHHQKSFCSLSIVWLFNSAMSWNRICTHTHTY